MNFSQALPQTVVTILSVNGGATVNPGDAFAVTFTVEDGDGNTILISELDRISLYVSGPTTNYQRVIAPDGNFDNFMQNADGTYTYMSPDPFPGTYLPPEEDSDAFGPEDGEMTGMALINGTYTVAVEARRTFTTTDGSVRKAGDNVLNFIVGGGTLSPREFVTREACNVCHVDLKAHGDNRSNVTGCLLCHTRGSEDLINDDPDKQTPGISVDFARMIHRIHTGAELPYVMATMNSADPWLYRIIGYRESVHDYSEVHFPVMPGGTGFNEQMRNCDACHAGAAQGDTIHDAERITKWNCTTCHQDLDFETGTILDQTLADVQDGLLTKDQLDAPEFRAAPGGVSHAVPVTEDGDCEVCHGQGRAWDAEALHLPALLDPDVIDGLKVVITSVGGSADPDFFVPGEFPEITFNVLDADDNPVPIDDLTVGMVIAGPVENYQRIFPVDATTTTTVNVKGAGGVPATGTGPFTYTSPEAIPANYPPPFNDSADFTKAMGDGELQGDALLDGNYTVMIYAYQNVMRGGTAYRESSIPGSFEFRIGAAGDTPGYAGVVTDETCNSCHGDLRFHGNTRRGIINCLVCHTAGTEDRPNVLAGQTQAPEPDTMDFKVMIHKLHAARTLYVVEEGGMYDIVGFAFGQPLDTGNVHDFSNGWLPAMPQGPAACETCHADDAWKQPTQRDGVSIWKVACTSCHDSPDTAVHVQLNTVGVGEEACAVCHGDGALFSVEDSHAAP